jgi:hypothetical protein
MHLLKTIDFTTHREPEGGRLSAGASVCGSSKKNVIFSLQNGLTTLIPKIIKIIFKQ